MRLESQKAYARACRLMPGGVNSPVRAFCGLETHPLVVSSGKGDTITDVDGLQYVDYCMSWGALILGHAPAQVVRKASQQMRKGSSFGIATAVESSLAEKVLEYYPSMRKVRFVSSGTEATMTALRLARGFTGKPCIVKFNGHYHGHTDSLLIQAGSGVACLPSASSAGIPEGFMRHTVSLPFNEIETCRTFLRARTDVAAVILEPVTGNMGVVPASAPFMQMLREETARAGALLIFDEVITGFRVGLRGAQHLYGIDPDLTCLGKVVGGGFPVAACGGKQEIMDRLAPLGDVYQAGTLSGNPVAMSAGLQTLEEVAEEGFYSALEEKAKFLLEPIEEFICKKNLPVCLQRIGSMFTFFFGVKKVEKREDLQAMDREAFGRFFRFLLSKGVYLSPSAFEANFICSAHSKKNLVRTRALILDYLSKEV